MKLYGCFTSLRSFPLSLDKSIKFESTSTTTNRAFQTLNDISYNRNRIQTHSYRFVRINAQRTTRWNSSNQSSFSKHYTPASFSSSSIAYDDEPTFLPIRKFPSLILGKHGYISPQGTFAEIQAQFLRPDPDIVESLAQKIHSANIGIVAHYYMDVELQGVLTAMDKKQTSSSSSTSKQLHRRRIAIADSLAMGDAAVKMCQDGAKAIICLGVDFMSESVSAILARNGFDHIPVYRATSKSIGCSLAESAESRTYQAWLQKFSQNTTMEELLHVIYINTSLETKAISSSILPTITCTSSNVLATMLEASAQRPNVQILYGPDTYMGNNLQSLLGAVSSHWTDQQISQSLHPLHNRDSIRRLRDCIHVYPHGNCVVHHMFGKEVVRVATTTYPDAFVTAHLEVPGEMFDIALQKSFTDEGVVGSTSDILRFISEKVSQSLHAEDKSSISSNRNSNRHETVKRLQFILGTEAGMVTSIVRSVSEILNNAISEHVEVEIIFPVSSEAVTRVEDQDNPLAVVPGVPSGEGCSTAGGCATCPFMKMNSLDSLNDVVDMIISNNHEAKLKSHRPPNRLSGKSIDGVDALELGYQSILFMRYFMKEKKLSDDLLRLIRLQRSNI